MSKAIIEVLVIILLVTYVFGKFTILLGPTTHDKIQKTICATEDDGSALVWNIKLVNSLSEKILDNPENPQGTRFYSTCTAYNREIDYKLNDLYYGWSEKHWDLTNTMHTPIGPMFDQQWERLKEHKCNRSSIESIILNNTNTIVISFSIRADAAVHILICNIEHENNLCYWIKLDFFDESSIIKKCPKGVPPNLDPKLNSSCTTEQGFLLPKSVRTFPYEWKTFVLAWNSQTRNISLYDPNRLIMTYADTDEYDYIHFTYKMYINCEHQALIRYHIYDYFYTAIPNAILISREINMRTKAVCLQMLIGLCAKCDADILLRKYSNNEVLQNVTVKGSSVITDHGFPVWHFVKIMANLTQLNLTRKYDTMKIEVVPKLNSKNVNPVWAIRNIHQCRQRGCLRQSAIFIYKGLIQNISTDLRESNTDASTSSWWVDVVCQKLFYKEQFVLRFSHFANVTMRSDINNCAVGYVGPACQFNCQSALKTKPDCRGVRICHDNGCNCPPGYVGSTCEEPCNNNTYGHTCKRKCGSCLKNKPCDIVTGECRNGCNNTEDVIYASPFCQIGIGKPNEVQIVNTDPETIIVTVPIEWKKEYEEIGLTYSFKIKTPNNIFGNQLEWNKMSPSTMKLLGVFTNLQPATTYEIVPIFSLSNTFIYGTWKSMTTDVPLAVPSNELTVRAIPLSSSEVSLVWTFPAQSNKKAKECEIHLQLTEYLGCNDYGRFVSRNKTIIQKTNNTKIRIEGLHAYAKYDVQVITNSQHSRKEGKTSFVTNMTDIPTTTFSRLRIQFWELSWSPPKDCTSISGPLKAAKIDIRGMSNNVKGTNVVISIKHESINLYNYLCGAEQYIAKIYALREISHPENNSAYEEYKFETPAKEPPTITNLAVVEVDTSHTPATIHLRWQSPRPPLNGILRDYSILIGGTHKQRDVSIHLNESCALWDNYICQSIRHTNDDIQVVAYNIGVSNPSPAANVTKEMLRNATPDVPRDINFTIRSKSIVDLEWLHPWRTANRLCCFRIVIREISSTLRSSVTPSSENKTQEYPVTHYKRKYHTLLYLLPSTRYNISIQTVTILNQSSNTNSVVVQTLPNINLDGNLVISKNKSNTAIVLHVPKVRNDTCDSVTYIVVIGLNTCKQHEKLPKNLLKHVSGERVDLIWQAAKRPTDELAGKKFTINNDQDTNCPLKDGESYKIMIIITTRDNSSEPVISKKESIYFGELYISSGSYVWLIVSIILFSAGSGVWYFYKK